MCIGKCILVKQQGRCVVLISGGAGENGIHCFESRSWICGFIQSYKYLARNYDPNQPGDLDAS
jgi:hypothetical protein